MPAEQFIFAAVAEVVETLQSVGRQGGRVAQQYASHHHAGRRRKQGVAVLHRLPYPFGRRETVQARVVLFVEVEGQTFIYEIRNILIRIRSRNMDAAAWTHDLYFTLLEDRQVPADRESDTFIVRFELNLNIRKIF